MQHIYQIDWVKNNGSRIYSTRVRVYEKSAQSAISRFNFHTANFLRTFTFRTRPCISVVCVEYLGEVLF